MRPVRTLLFSTLYPSVARPAHGIFVETRLRELLASGEIETRVVAPVPWFPSAHPRWGRYAQMARTPRAQVQHGVDVVYPRYPVLPKLGMVAAPWLLALASLGAIRRLQRQGFDFDVIDAHYFYPDGVAAAWLARRLGKPLVITARGSDINLIGEHPLARRMLQWAADQADACIGVSAALVESMRALGMPGDKLLMLRNGVDLDLFRPLDRAASLRHIGLNGDPLLLSVGNLLPVKGHELTIEAVSRLVHQHPGIRLAIAGSGPEEANLRRCAERFGVQDRVHLVGSIAHADLAHWYSAADLLLLASSREGWPNVLLEAMACGTPAVATAVGGVPEIVATSEAGRLVLRRTASSIAEGITDQLGLRQDRKAVRQYAEAFGWAPTTRAQVELFTRLKARVSARAAT